MATPVARLEDYLQPTTNRHSFSKPRLSADPRLRGNSRETSSASRRISDCNFLVWVFSPPRLVARLAPGGWGFPFALEVIRIELPSTTLRIRAAGFVCTFMFGSSTLRADKSVTRGLTVKRFGLAAFLIRQS